MSITIKVAGVDRSTYVSKIQPASYNDTLNGRGTGSIVFNVKFDQLATFRPIDGQTVLIEEDLGGGPVARFGGFLVEPEANELPDEEFVIFSCGMQDNNAIADRRTINATFDDIAFEDVVDAIVSNASNDGLTGESITLTGVVAGAAVSLDFPTIYVTEAFNDLAVAAGGWWWNIGHDKDLSFAPRTAVPAPADLTAANTLKKTVKVRPVKEKYRNVEIVFGGKDDFTITAMFEDATEIAARAALEGGTSGRYEHIEERQDILDSVLVEELAEDLVARFGLVTLMFECVTRDPGYASGQEVAVTFPTLELNAETFLIDSVSAQLVYTSEDGSDTEEIWYTISAITGDPFGGWMEHFRKRPGSSQRREIVPTPGVTVECDPGVVVHDPVPGPYEWFQASTTVPTKFPSAFGVTPLGDLLVTQRTGGLAGTDGCGGGTFPGFGGSPACFANRQMIAEVYTINEDNTVSTTPSFGASIDRPNAGVNIKNQIPISPDGRFALFTQMLTPGVDSAVMVYDISLNQFRGTVISTMANNGNWSEPIWLGDVVYFVDGTDSTIFIYDISDPDNPTEATFASSVTNASSIVASPNGLVLYVQGTSTKLAALDISSPLAPVEDTVLNITGGYGSMDIHPDGTSLIMFRRFDATTIRWTSITMTLNGTDIAFSTNDGAVPGTISTAVMKGRGCVWAGGDIVIVSSDQPTSPSNSFKAYTFDASNIDVVTFVEAFSYNHGLSANSGPIRSLEAAKFYMFFGGVTQQMTYSFQTFPVCKDLETQWPLQERFGGTGHKLYAPGDILYASGIESLARRAIGDAGQVLTVSAGVPIWETLIIPSGQDGADLSLLFVDTDVEIESTTLQNIPGLSASVSSGETIYFRADLFFDVDAEDSHRYAIGGTCEGDIRYEVRTLDDDTAAYSIIVSGQHAILGGEAFVPFGVLSGYTEISGSIDVTKDGTLVPQVALSDPIPPPPSLLPEFPDDTFGIFDEADSTKIIKFEAALIASGNTRTVAAEDGAMTMPLTSEWDDLTDAGDTVLHKHDIYAKHTGTPANNQLAVWTGAATVEGEPDVRYTGIDFEIDAGVVVTLSDLVFSISGQMTLVETEAQAATFFASAHNDGSGISAQFTGRKSRGTKASPTALINGSIIGLYGFVGHDGSSYSTVGRFDLIARESYSGSGHGSAFRYLTTPVGGTVLSTKVWITSDGHIYIGANGTEPGSGGGSLVIQQGDALVGMPNNTGAIQVKDVAGTAEVFAVNETGTATELSAHPDDVDYDPSEPMPWAHRAEQPHLGKRVTCDMARVVRVVEQLAEAAGVALPVDGLIHIEDMPSVEDWHATSEARADRDIADYEAWEKTEQDHATAVAEYERRVANEWEGLPSVTDPVHDAWLALPEGPQGKRYRLRRAVDDEGRPVRVREDVEEPASRVLRVLTRKVKEDNGRPVVIREHVEAPEPPEPLGVSLDVPMVKPPPRWIQQRLEASGRWDQARHDAKVAEIEAWKTAKGLQNSPLARRR